MNEIQTSSNKTNIAIIITNHPINSLSKYISYEKHASNIHKHINIHGWYILIESANIDRIAELKRFIEHKATVELEFCK